MGTLIGGCCCPRCWRCCERRGDAICIDVRSGMRSRGALLCDLVDFGLGAGLIAVRFGTGGAATLFSSVDLALFVFLVAGGAVAGACIFIMTFWQEMFSRGVDEDPALAVDLLVVVWKVK